MKKRKKAVDVYSLKKSESTGPANGVSSDILLYFQTMLGIMPVSIFKTGDYSINFYSPGIQSPYAAISRFCVANQNNSFSVHDEVFFRTGNDGGQLVFDLSENFVFTKVPAKFDECFARFIREVQAASKQKGASIKVNGYGEIMYSDGNGWIRAQPVKDEVKAMWHKYALASGNEDHAPKQLNPNK